MSAEPDNNHINDSRKNYMALTLGQTLGISSIVALPYQAIGHGALGHILLYAVIFIFVGIPLLYMEYVVGQFTGRNCLEVWKVRPCLSHIAYVQIFWQIVNVIVSHVLSAFTLHYFLISFEDPIPYYTCGEWSTMDCNILSQNYTIHKDCVTAKEIMPYCSLISTTFPEYQYWRHYMLRLNKDGYYVAWRVSLASAILSVALFLSCYRRPKSVTLSLKFCILFIVSISILFLIASMLQKGVVVKFDEAVDADLLRFSNYVEFSHAVLGVLYNLSVGSGISFNLASRSSFRSPCYSNTVIIVVITWAITVINICNNAIMLCPYSFKNNIHPLDIVKYPLYYTFERMPRLLYDYKSTAFWLILNYLLIAISHLCFNIVTISSLIEIVSSKNSIVAKYPGTTTMIMMVALYVVSIPLLGNRSLNLMIDIQREIRYIPIFLAIVECLVFLLCYGLERFSEDVHFMLGVRPNAFIKLSWILSVIMLIYSFCVDLFTVYHRKYSSWNHAVGWWLLIFIIILIVVTAIGKISIAFYKKEIQKEIGLTPSWGPKSEILQRSRAMFTTHAMTKEYIYRQYHLQAGILMRQRSCNIRT